jgi:hypothetical protein
VLSTDISAKGRGGHYRSRTKVKRCWKGGGIALAALASIGLVASAAEPAAARVGGLAQARAAASGPGYWLVTSCGAVLAFGSAKFYGDVSHHRPVIPVVEILPAPDGKGYWLVGKWGNVWGFGSARFLGSSHVPPPGPVRIKCDRLGRGRIVASAAVPRSSTGTPGPNGVTGATGANGANGANGVKGATGPTGLQPPEKLPEKGETGEKGPTGKATSGPPAPPAPRA